MAAAAHVTPAATFVDVVQRQADFQRRLGHHFNEMSIAERVGYVKQMYVAAVKELGEALDETSWKEWALGDWVHEDKLVGELTDVLCFLINMFLVALPGLTPPEVARVILESHSIKADLNTWRQDRRYDGTHSNET